MEKIAIALVTWFVVSQLIAGVLAGRGAREGDVVNLWVSVFILAPLVPLYGLIYLLARLVYFWRPVTVDDIL